MKNHSTTWFIQPGGSLLGDICVPGDKSISHRAVMLSALAQGGSHIKSFLQGEDTLATVRALRTLGVSIEQATAPSANSNTAPGVDPKVDPNAEQHPEKTAKQPPHQTPNGLRGGELLVTGVGLQGLRPPMTPLNLGNAGTAMRLLAGILAGQPFASELTGDLSLCRRPMARIITPLQAMGASLTAMGEGPGACAPLKIEGSSPLNSISYQLPVASAQVKSCVLLAGLYATGVTAVIEPALTRDHTERMLARFGVPITRQANRLQIHPVKTLQAQEITIPGDLSSAAFFMVGASLAPTSHLIIRDVGVNPTRTGVIHILQLMGADIRLHHRRHFSGEPVADIEIKAAKLHGIDIPPKYVSSAMDEFPAIFIAAASAEGVTRLRGAEELRVKESDRIAAMSAGLLTLGIECEVLADGITIRGGKFTSGEVNSLDDHRIAMAFAMAGLRARGEICIQHCENVLTSFPNFRELAYTCGLQIDESRTTTSHYH